MQIVIHEISHFTLMTELLTITVDFAFRCKPIWGNSSVSLFPLVLTSFGGRVFPQKLFGGAVFPHVPRSP